MRWRKLLANLVLNVKKVTLKEPPCNRWFKSNCKNDNLTLADVIAKSDSYQECMNRHIEKTTIVSCKSSKLLIPQWNIMKFIIDTWRDRYLFFVKNLTHSDCDDHVFFWWLNKFENCVGGNWLFCLIKIINRVSCQVSYI